MIPKPRPRLGSVVSAGASPNALSALERLSLEQASRLLDEIAVALKSGRDVRLLRQTVANLLGPLIARTEKLDTLPEPLFRWALTELHVQDLERFAKLPPGRMAEAIEAYEVALARADLRLLRSKLDADIWDDYVEQARFKIAGTVFTPAFNGFRSSHLQKAFEADLRLGRRYAEPAALNWALEQAARGRFRNLLVAEFGDDINGLLRPLRRSARATVPPQMLGPLRELFKSQAGYEAMREALESVGSLGHLLEVDHILEKRFLHSLGMALDQLDFPSFLVPKNVAVARNLLLQGVSDFQYVHSFKTQRMRVLFPYGAEGSFNLQEIYNGYRLHYVHELRLGNSALANLDNIFEEAARLAPDRLPPGGLDRTPLPPELLLASVLRAQARIVDPL